MAVRPLFKSTCNAPFFEQKNIEFRYYSGFAESQKKKCVASLHEAAVERYPDLKLLEISSYSDCITGQLASAFNLRMEFNGKPTTVEGIFQSSKVFENGGPYLDLLYENPYIIKKDIRLRESESVIGFRLGNCDYPLFPKTLFYDWIYINALVENPVIADELLKYNAFTDIVFNPQKSINCQARSAAVFTGLFHSGLLRGALKSIDDFYYALETGFEKGE